VTALDGVRDDEWRRLAARRIYFGHQSVGYNIVAGLNEIVRQRPSIGLRIIESTEPHPTDAPALVHSQLGSNTDPASKLDGFAARLASGTGAWADLAFFKFCYADIHGRTNVDELLTHYEATFAEISRRFPRLLLLHLTVPLTAPPSLPKRWAKRLLGKPVREFADNAKREAFNDALRARYGANGFFFDVARTEATRPDGRLERDGQALYAGYTADRGHLNGLGQLVVGTALLRVLVELPT
jgi:hypothetical protein